jgi:hypothetical protein
MRKTLDDNPDQEEDVIRLFPNSQYENWVTNLLLYGNFGPYILSGGMGTGKSSISKTIMDRLRQHFHDSPGHCFMEAKFDFNGNLGSNGEIVTIFKERLFSMLQAQLHRYLESNFHTLENFLRDANSKENSNDFAEFYDYYSQALADPSWSNKSQSTRIYELLHYISKKRSPLDLLISYIKYLRNHYPRDVFFVLLIDNIDRCDQKEQFDIIQTIFPIVYAAKIKCLIPLRRATYKRNQKKLQDSNKTKASYSYGLIGHTSISPVAKVQRRIAYTLENFDNMEIFRGIKKEYLDALKGRLKHILNLVEDESTLLSKFLSALCGKSIRLCLSLIERLVINNVIDFQSEFQYLDLSMKALMVRANTDNRFDNQSDVGVINVFVGNQNRNELSLIPFFVLQLVYENRQNVEKRQIRSILKECLSLNSRWKKSEILDALNCLMDVNRPLIWSDETSFYNPDNILPEDLDDVLHITEIGSGYYDYLLKHTTQYYQECFLSVKWIHNYAPKRFDSKSFTQRFSVMRDCVKEIFTEETEIRIKNYIPPSKIVFQTILSSLVAIINSDIERYKSRLDIMQEIQNWDSLGVQIDMRYKTSESTVSKINNYFLVKGKLEKSFK